MIYMTKFQLYYCWVPQITCVDRLTNYETFSFFLVHHYSVRLVCLHLQICLNFKVPQDLCVLWLKNKLRCMIILCFASLEDYSVYHLSNFVVSTVPVTFARASPFCHHMCNRFLSLFTHSTSRRQLLFINSEFNAIRHFSVPGPEQQLINPPSLFFFLVKCLLIFSNVVQNLFLIYCT